MEGPDPPAQPDPGVGSGGRVLVGGDEGVDVGGVHSGQAGESSAVRIVGKNGVACGHGPLPRGAGVCLDNEPCAGRR